MFHVIKPQEHHLNQSRINPFLKGLQDAAALKGESNLKQATFILVDEKIKEIKGGILLLKQNTAILASEVREYLLSFCPHTTETWAGMIALQMSENITGHNFESICKALYPALYEKLVVFSVKENIPFLCLKMSRIEHLTIDMFGSWAYVLEVMPAASSDGLFHGILALSGIKPNFNHFGKKSTKPKGSYLYSSSAPQLLCAQECNKINTFYKKKGQLCHADRVIRGSRCLYSSIEMHIC